MSAYSGFPFEQRTANTTSMAGLRDSPEARALGLNRQAAPARASGESRSHTDQGPFYSNQRVPYWNDRRKGRNTEDLAQYWERRRAPTQYNPVATSSVNDMRLTCAHNHCARQAGPGDTWSRLAQAPDRDNPGMTNAEELLLRPSL